VERHGDFYAKRGATLLGDDLYSHQPFCQAIQAKHLHFILVCKPDSHPDLEQIIAFLAANQVLDTKVVRRWLGKYAEIATYRFANQVPLNAEAGARQVNWCEVTVVREDKGEQTYKNAFDTDFEIRQTNIEAIVRMAGRAGKSKMGTTMCSRPRAIISSTTLGMAANRWLQSCSPSI